MALCEAKAVGWRAVGGFHALRKDQGAADRARTRRDMGKDERQALCGLGLWGCVMSRHDEIMALHDAAVGSEKSALRANKAGELINFQLFCKHAKADRAALSAAVAELVRDAERFAVCADRHQGAAAGDAEAQGLFWRVRRRLRGLI